MTVPSDCFFALAPATPTNTFPAPRAQVPADQSRFRKHDALCLLYCASMRSPPPEPSNGPCLFPILNINFYALQHKLSQMTVPSDCFLTLAPTTPDNTFPAPRAQVATCAGGFEREAV